jgi:4a-hydroxytetrahydrobiopterin dehydratase
MPSMSDLAQRTCVPCRGGTPPLDSSAAESLLSQLDSNWRIKDGKILTRDYVMKNFAQALQGAVTLGAIAQDQGHHPDLRISWGKLGVDIWTHKIDGLTESDFILAAKFDEALS